MKNVHNFYIKEAGRNAVFTESKPKQCS